MRLNTLKPAVGAKRNKIRVGRGIGCGCGKTCGRGHKGQTARSGYSKKLGFEGGQMPMQRRVPKFGFRSRSALVRAEITLNDLAKVAKAGVTRIGLLELKEAGIVRNDVLSAKVILSGKLDKSITVYGIGVTAGAKQAIEKLGGKIEAAVVAKPAKKLARKEKK
jgi:large subunit ribosomal protein L15